MVEVCLYVILALDSHIGPRAKALGTIWLPQCQYDLEAHLGHIITCMYLTRYYVSSASRNFHQVGGGEGPGPPDSKKLGQRCFVIFAVFLVLMHLQLI